MIKKKKINCLEFKLLSPGVYESGIQKNVLIMILSKVPLEQLTRFAK